MRSGLRLGGILLLLAGAVLLSGCASSKKARGVPPRRVDLDAENTLGAGTGIGAQDIRAVTEKMSRQILQVPEIAQAPKPPVIAILPVNNNTRFPIDKELFTLRIRASLQETALELGNRQVRFVARERMDDVLAERRRRDAGEVSATASPKEIYGADYYLTGELRGHSQAGSTGQSDYVFYYFQLVDTESSEEIWGGMYEIRREGLEDVTYR